MKNIPASLRRLPLLALALLPAVLALLPAVLALPHAGHAQNLLDTTFANPNLNSVVGTLKLDASGKILAGGFFTTAGSGDPTRNYLARFHADGTLDTTFANPNLNATAFALAVDSSGKILVGGSFTAAGSRVDSRLNVTGGGSPSGLGCLAV